MIGKTVRHYEIVDKLGEGSMGGGKMNGHLRIFILCTLITLLIVGCANNAEQTATQELGSQQQLPIIDMHVHTFQWDRYGDPPPPNPVSGIIPAARSDKY